MTLTASYAGASRYFSYYPFDGYSLFVAVLCGIGGLPSDEIALLDTAAEWCVLRGDIAARLGVLEDSTGPRVRLSSRHGLISGHFERLPIEFPADEGQSITVDATWFVSPDWPGPSVIGWRGCLERMNFGIISADEMIYFAAP